MAIYLPNFNDQRVKDFCTDAGYPVSVDGFYNALGALGFTGGLSDRWKAYLINTFGYFAGMHIGNYTDEALFSFFQVEDPSVPSAGTASTTEYNLGASGSVAHGNIMRYSIYDIPDQDIDPNSVDYPTSIISYEGHQPFNANVIQRAFGPGVPSVGTNNYDNLYFMRFTSMPTLDSTLSQGILSFSIFSVLSAEGTYTPLRIRAIKTAPTWPTATNGTYVRETSPLGYGNYTTNYIDWAPEFYNGDYSAWAGSLPMTVSIDVTHILKELVGTAGGAGTYIFVFETLDTVDFENGTTVSQFRMTSASTAGAMPKLAITTGNDERKYQLKTPTAAEVVYYIPFDRLDITDSSTALSSWRVVAGNQQWTWSRTGLGDCFTGTMKASSYGANITATLPELTINHARKLIAPFDQSQADWYGRVNFAANDYMMIVQHKQATSNTGATWLWDLVNNTGAVCELSDDGGHVGYRLKAGTGNADNQTVLSDIPFNDSVGSVKTLVAVHIASTGQWYVGYHNADKWYWKNGPVNTNNQTNQAISGIAIGPGVYQGVAVIEFTTARSLNEYKQLAHDMRTYWAANFKGLPEDL